MKLIKRTWLTKAFLLLMALLFTNNAFSQTVIRGPYLQQATDARMVVKWRTDAATSSVVRFGLSPSTLFQTQTVAGSRTDHEVLLTGLSTSTQYFYSVGNSEATLAGDSSYHFRTSPIPGSSEFVRLWVVGDSGIAGSASRNVRDAYKNKFPGSSRANMMIMLGDNAYEDGTDSEYQTAMFDAYPEILRQTPVWSTIGNHDVDRFADPLHDDPYFSIFSLPEQGESGGVPSGTEAYYSYDYGNIHFVVLDSYSTDRSVNGAMLSWLENDLIVNNKEWLIVFFHHPPYSKGSHDSDTEGFLIDMRTRALPILESYGVDLVLSGHSHSYERSYLIDGHYGDSDSFSANNFVDSGSGKPSLDGAYTKPDSAAAPNMGAVYIVAGSSSRVSGGSLDHEAMYASLNELGSVVIDVNDTQLNTEFLNDSGQVTDSFTINKGMIVDNTRPVLVGVNVVNTQLIQVEFSEAVTELSASDISNFQINSGINVISASLSTNNKVVSLVINSLVLDISYTLTVNNIKDETENTIATDSEIEFALNSVVTRNYQAGGFPNSAYEGMIDSYLYSGAATVNYGNSGVLLLDGDDSGSDVVSLLRWDISDIPEGSIVTNVSVSLGVFNPSSNGYQVYSLLREWAEDSVSWNNSGVTNWASPGAQGSTDSGSTVLGTVSPTSAGTFTLNLNSTGVQLVQNWVDGVTPNYGFLISNLASSDGVDIYSSESNLFDSRPKFSVTFEITDGDGNLSPLVSAGPNQLVMLPASASLDGTVSDDGLPTPQQVTTAWTKISGPGTVTFENASSVDTRARFSVDGEYVLRLTASDGNRSRSDDVVIRVEPIDPEAQARIVGGVVAAISILLLDE